MNFCEVLSRRPADEPALIELRPDGRRCEHSFGELVRASGRLAGRLAGIGVGRGDVVMTVMGANVEWVLTMLAALRLGAIALPCVAQARAKDIALRARLTHPLVVVGTPATESEIARARVDGEMLVLSGIAELGSETPDPVDLKPEDPALIMFTSGTTGEPKAVVHGTSYLSGQALQGKHWLDVRPGDLCWCTAAPGWAKSTRNAFVTPWLMGGRVLLQDARFDPIERLEVIRREGVNVLCMSPTEYRMAIGRAELLPLPDLHAAVAAGEPLDAATCDQWRIGTGVALRDGYGQTETGAMTAVGPDGAAPVGSMGRSLPGLRTEVIEGELCLDPASSPTVCLGYLDGPRPEGLWHTGDLVEVDEAGYLWFRGRADDVIISAGYRIDPTEVEAVLNAHPAVIEAAVVGFPDHERGEIVRAVVVLREGENRTESMIAELQGHVKLETAPYKYPRRIDFEQTLPRTATGKLKRSVLREGAA